MGAFLTGTVHQLDTCSISIGLSTPTKELPALSRPYTKIPPEGYFIARAMGADPTASPVTGECSTVELRPHMLSVPSKVYLIKFSQDCPLLCRWVESRHRLGFMSPSF